LEPPSEVSTELLETDRESMVIQGSPPRGTGSARLLSDVSATTKGACIGMKVAEPGASSCGSEGAERSLREAWNRFWRLGSSRRSSRRHGASVTA
jgi:hypothetical protein